MPTPAPLSVDIGTAPPGSTTCIAPGPALVIPGVMTPAETLIAWDRRPDRQDHPHWFPGVRLLQGPERAPAPETLDKAVRMLEQLGLHGYTAVYIS